MPENTEWISRNSKVPPKRKACGAPMPPQLIVGTVKTKPAFTLLELLVTAAIIGVLAALLLPALSKAREKSRRIACASNLRQINQSIHLYADDWSESLPILPDPNPYPNGVGAYYKQLVKGYLGLSGPASPNETIFTCPSDGIIRTQLTHAFTSFTFDGYEVGPGALPRITGKKLCVIPRPSRAVLVGEYPAFWGGSWHPLMRGASLGARASLSFVDGHVGFTRIYWNGVAGSHPADYEPPPAYDYSWDGE